MSNLISKNCPKKSGKFYESINYATCPECLTGGANVSLTNDISYDTSYFNCIPIPTIPGTSNLDSSICNKSLT